MPRKKMSEEEYAKAVSGGMNDLMERKRKRNPQFYTKEFKTMVVTILADVKTKDDATKKKLIKAHSPKK